MGIFNELGALHYGEVRNLCMQGRKLDEIAIKDNGKITEGWKNWTSPTPSDWKKLLLPSKKTMMKKKLKTQIRFIKEK